MHTYNTRKKSTWANHTTMKPKILIGLPTMGTVHTLLMTVIVSWIAEAKSTGEYNLSIYPTINVQPVDNARNDIVKHFLESDCTHLLFVDADTIPPLNAIKRLLAHDKPIISALTPIVEMTPEGDPWRKWNCVDENDQHMKPNTGVRMCKGAGSSCIMIKREVFDVLEKPYYEFRYKDDSGKEKMISEDILFVIKCLSKGIKTYADTSIICQHQKEFLF